MALRTMHSGAAWPVLSRRQASNLVVHLVDAPSPEPDFTSADEGTRQILVLRILIEDFGGEATAGSLSKRMADREQIPQGSDSSCIREIRSTFASLQARGAVTLEHHGEVDVVARITRHGAELAYRDSSL